MINRCDAIAAVALILTSSPAFAADISGCHFKTVDSSLALNLSGRKIADFLKSPVEFGRFEIENHGSTDVVLHGTRHDGVFYIEQPYVYVQALTTDMNWQVEGAIPGEFKTPPDELVVHPNKTAIFLAYIHFPKALNSTGLLRLMMPLSESQTCLLSTPFQEYEAKDRG